LIYLKITKTKLENSR